MNETRCRDKYDEAVEYLTQHPEQIQDAWGKAATYPGGSLFHWCTPSKQPYMAPKDSQDTGKSGVGCSTNCGCLTQVREASSHMQWAVAYTKALTQKIMADQRLPMQSADIEVEHLPLFAAWQRFMDKYFAAGCDDALLNEEVMP